MPENCVHDTRLYAFGSNGSGQLGIGHREDVSIPTLCNMRSDSRGASIKLAAGGGHTLLILPSGSLYTTGENEDGRSGQGLLGGHNGDFSTSQCLGAEHARKFKFCSATWEASFVVTEGNTIYSLGSGSKGELGQGQEITTVPTEQGMENFPPPTTEIVDISSCVAHTVIVLSNGDVYGWGNGRKGQLGEPAQICWSPRKIEGIDFKVLRVACGREFTYLIGDPAGGKHAVLGSNKWNVRSNAPQFVQGWQDIGASWGSIFVLLSDGSLRSWGRNDHGQLPPDGLPPLQRIAIGSEHALALTDDGKVLAWGWGEHGNCGPSIDEAGDVSGRWNEIVVRNPQTQALQSIADIGAGCATSWIWVQL